ncbi:MULTISPECIES: NAD(P)H-dependent flavin oxidoreductase [Falsihalocynthiibacter]|uniref:NAD(P)H-dependent flavin oxidoreductase n=1 Tax=Falsihalocynthiibacter TaxID=2854182 RepID=UPI0030019650
MARITTRLTEKFELDTPIISAPMAFAAGGELARAVSLGGGLGLIGGAYGDPDWVDAEFAKAGDAKVGVGFITWKLAAHSQVLEQALERSPAAVFLSFGDIAPYVDRVHRAGVALIAQVTTLADAQAACGAGADVIVAQGSEAGGHGEARATMTLVPEVADWVARNMPHVFVVAAGGIADGRGLAAALMLGAQGAVIGSRFWASDEAMVHPKMHAAAMAATGDDTIRSSVMDVARHLKWPPRFTARVLKNAFTRQWHDDLDGLLAVAQVEAEKWRRAWEAGDVEGANTFVGQAVGLLHDIRPAAQIIENITDEAATLLGHGPAFLEA